MLTPAIPVGLKNYESLFADGRFINSLKVTFKYVIVSVPLQLAFALGLTLKEADRLLQAAGASGLYCKDRRDAIIIFCLDHGYSLQKTDEELYRFGEDTIC